MARHETWNAHMKIPVQKYDAKQPRNMETWHPMHGMNPKHKTRHMHWPIAIQNMHYLIMKYEERIKTVPKNAYFQFITRPKIECK